jgi:hypothetical protein
MGSYISLENNTSDTWICKVGPNQITSMISSFIVGVLAFLLFSLAMNSLLAPEALLPLIMGTSGSIALVTVSAKLFTIPTRPPSAGRIDVDPKSSLFAQKVVESVRQKAASKGYVTLVPGQYHQWGKFTLSRLNQATCIKTTIIDERTVNVSTATWRPLWSGVRANQVSKYDIQSFLDRGKPLESTLVVGQSNDTQTQRLLESVDKAQLFYIYPNGTVSSQDEN